MSQEKGPAPGAQGLPIEARVMGVDLVNAQAAAAALAARDARMERVRALLVEAEGFAALSPQGRENIAEAIAIIDAIPAPTGTGKGE